MKTVTAWLFAFFLLHAPAVGQLVTDLRKPYGVWNLTIEYPRNGGEEFLAFAANMQSELTVWHKNIIEKSRDMSAKVNMLPVTKKPNDPIGDIAFLISVENSSTVCSYNIFWWRENGAKKALQYVVHAINYCMGNKLSDLPHLQKPSSTVSK